MKKTSLIGGIKENFPSGLVVFLVALPLCLGIALASGAPPLSGIIAGIVGGLVVGTISNSNISVSGPAAGLTAIVLTAITDLGAFELFLCAGIIAGLIQLVLGFVRAGSISNYFPNNVIEGMLAAIGIIIILKQIPHALGFDKDYEGHESIFDNGLNFGYFTELFGAIHPGAIVITLVSVAILIAWDKIHVLKRMKMLPGALVAVIVSILLNQLFKMSGSSLAIQTQHLVSLPVPQSFDDFKNLITTPDFNGFTNPKVWIVGATIAIVASIETLLCIEASDRLDRQRRITDTNLELKAQGIGNLISSFIGGLPMTSVVVRSSANANAGATSKISAIIHGVFLLICVLSIPVVLNLIPLATLAAVLILVGYKLAKPATFKHFWHLGKFQFIPFVATVVAVVATDLLKGVGIGLTISVFYILQGNMKRAYYLSRERLDDADGINIKLAEEVSFLNKAAIKKTLKNIKPNSTVIIDARSTSYIATDVLEMIQDFANIRAKEQDINVELIGFKTSYRDYERSEDSHILVTHKRAM
ncbi:MFS superfamily sulfate permease-like transporter [Chryseobacterium bernardetii]|jgi:MFS superfamily sulfate permease-like transporter|uniref:MFS superfamily sulfate permease-like transporter n=3 Tax=Chryseobacterium TaxID=59732 RepID=A0A543ECA8_9FLAO|nr:MULTISPECIES: SulP family inorganic anion transporter [Chryseobacterium]MDR6372586.1 MFS superfamily sulfate permease-like transporter [Chryseobacterium vietnamense]MDR6442804.1 MFS superfamily sulfate permease-like transporter [Chryseobacterium bernardetii]MDR6460152.1 MFS superfamily sulfate permease-like transporter [Chryseobacterium vietnamense]MDR6488911.1 MFS superfamily sulfate permease-like transporter [Chryseobacterium vietnamense]TQM19220.1 MFS superfamily sulfate permease-like tr